MSIAACAKATLAAATAGREPASLGEDGEACDGARAGPIDQEDEGHTARLKFRRMFGISLLNSMMHRLGTAQRSIREDRKSAVGLGSRLLGFNSGPGCAAVLVSHRGLG